jgi:hypothetical protein
MLRDGRAGGDRRQDPGGPQMMQRRDRGATVFSYALALSVLAVAGAAAYRVAAFRDPLSFGIGADGVNVKIGQARTELTQASTQLKALQGRLDAEAGALAQAEAQLREKDAEVRKLLAELQSLAKRADAGPGLRAIAPRISSLAQAPATASTPAAETLAMQEQEVRTQLLATGQKIERADSILRSIGR